MLVAGAPTIVFRDREQLATSLGDDQDTHPTGFKHNVMTIVMTMGCPLIHNEGLPGQQPSYIY